MGVKQNHAKRDTSNVYYKNSCTFFRNSHLLAGQVMFWAMRQHKINENITSMAPNLIIIDS